MAFVFNREALRKLRQEKQQKECKEKDARVEDGSAEASDFVAGASYAVRFCSKAEVQSLRATNFVWPEKQGAGYSLDDDRVLDRLASCVQMARQLGSTRALKMQGVFGHYSERYNTSTGPTLRKIHAIPSGTSVLMFYRIDDKTRDAWDLTDKEVAELMLKSLD